MKPLQKAIQIRLEKRCPIQEIIDELLRDYCSTPHPATGSTLGDMMLKGRYRTKFSHLPNCTENQIQEEKIHDSHRKEVANFKINASSWQKYPNIIQGDKILEKQSSKTNTFLSQFDPTPHMVTYVQGSRYELVADNDYNNVHTIIRHISDIKQYKPYQHPQRYHSPSPTQSTHKYSSLNNTYANPAFNDTASPYTAPFGMDHTFTTKLQLPPYQYYLIPTQKKNKRERGGQKKRNTSLPAKYADFVVNIPGRRVENI